MNDSLKRPILLVGCLLAGSMDAVSGLLLMLSPGFTLNLMRVPAVVSEAEVFIRFIGAFVFSVGCLYLFAFRSGSADRSLSYVRFVFGVTAWDLSLYNVGHCARRVASGVDQCAVDRWNYGLRSGLGNLERVDSG